jgi:hypothetical protein
LVRDRRATGRGELEASMERQSMEGAISIVSSTAQSEQANARNVGSYSLRQWLLEEGSQGGVSSVSVQSQCFASREDGGGNGGRGSKKLLKEPLQRDAGMLSGPCDKGRKVGFRWEEEVEPFSSSCGIFHSISPNHCGYKKG